MAYQVKLSVFEGPLDLLLFLIKKNEVNIYDIPIADITQQYMEYIKMMKILDLEVAGEFMLMAATLMRIKVQMMLPVPESEEEEIEDPRTRLVERLLEYQRYKEASETLGKNEEKQRQRFHRVLFSKEERPEAGYNWEENLSLFDLLDALQQVLMQRSKIEYYEVQLDEISMEERMAYVLEMCEKHSRILFTDMLQETGSRMFLVITFLAILELARRHQILLFQANPFKEIWVSAAQ